MYPLRNSSDYRRAIEHIRLLQGVLSTLAKIKGNLDPDVLAVSQEIDEYVVSVQQYWQKHGQEALLG
ncbi:Spo0E family sporulation regulatory protein-aspartic acid phosphatase [Sulfobacillus thermosulfidooxidans]|uniref:Spo0E family sporulation regulatory protein-aspartic acid phosphatase n=1 Tax=Sulfobacillus thermosulfidooxidans TaxID=28034 RepID=UPI0006B42995|nr:Spo0E family sporulation regulatory protein-aspartic acid phosphatase [Sulfobacillus thermosulfidooxidans]